MEGGGEEIKNTCTKKAGEGVGGRGKPGGGEALSFGYIFFLFYFLFYFFLGEGSHHSVS